jgi:hypothetical protein
MSVSMPSRSVPVFVRVNGEDALPVSVFVQADIRGRKVEKCDSAAALGHAWRNNQVLSSTRQLSALRHVSILRLEHSTKCLN